jgi:hypothetical protein
MQNFKLTVEESPSLMATDSALYDLAYAFAQGYALAVHHLDGRTSIEHGIQAVQQLLLDRGLIDRLTPISGLD